MISIIMGLIMIGTISVVLADNDEYDNTIETLYEVVMDQAIELAVLKTYLYTGNEYSANNPGDLDDALDYIGYFSKYAYSDGVITDAHPNDLILHHKHMMNNNTDAAYYKAEATLWKEKYTQLLATTGGANVTSELDRLEKKIDINHDLMFKFRADLKAAVDSINFIKDHLNMVR